MAKDINGKTITMGSKVFDTFSGDYGVVISIPSDGDYDDVKVKYSDGDDYAPPIELELCE